MPDEEFIKDDFKETPYGLIYRPPNYEGPICKDAVMKCEKISDEEWEKELINIRLERSRCTGCGQELRKSGNAYLACKCMWTALKKELDNENEE